MITTATVPMSIELGLAIQRLGMEEGSLRMLDQKIAEGGSAARRLLRLRPGQLARVEAARAALAAATAEVEPQPALPEDSPVARLERERAEAAAALARIDDELAPFHRSIEHGDGAFDGQTARRHDALLLRREVVQARVWDAEDAIAARREEATPIAA